MHGIHFDKNCWPRSNTTIVEQKPYDLNELWSDHIDQASVFVAEALISNPPSIYLAFTAASDIAVALWEVGGDTIVVSEPLADLIDKSYRDYEEIRSPEQEKDVKETLVQLEKISAALERARDHLEKQLKDYAAHPTA